MKKAVLSNRIFMNRTPELHEFLKLNLTYTVPSKVYGNPDEIVCDVTRINKNILSIPIGRIDLIPEDYIIVDNRSYVPTTFPDFKFTLREDQQDVYEKVEDSVIIVANPSWGKTFTGISIATKLKQKTLIIVHTKYLLDQWVFEIKKTMGIDAGIIGDSKFDIDSPIVVGTMQSIKNKILSIKDKFGTVMVDECHHVPASVFKSVVDALKARYKIGLTATPWRRDGQHIILYNYFGGPEKEIRTKDNNSLKPTIILVNSNIKMPGNASIPWGTRLTDLYNDTSYMELILNLSRAQADRGHLVLTVADRVEFLTMCAQILEDFMLVTGSSTDRDFLASGKRGLLGTGKIYSEGVNIPPLSSLILGMPINNRGMLEQLIGRIRRPHKDKLDPEVIDIVLKGKTGRNQSIQRINYYSENNFKIKQI